MCLTFDKLILNLLGAEQVGRYLEKTDAGNAELDFRLIKKVGAPLERGGGGNSDHAALGEFKELHRLISAALAAEKRLRNGVVFRFMVPGDGVHKIFLVAGYASRRFCAKMEMMVASHAELAYTFRYVFNSDRRKFAAFAETFMGGRGFWSHVPPEQQPQRWGMTASACRHMIRLLDLKSVLDQSKTFMPDFAWFMEQVTKGSYQPRCWKEVAAWSSVQQIVVGLYFEVELWDLFAGPALRWHRTRHDDLLPGHGLRRWFYRIHFFERLFWDKASEDPMLVFRRTARAIKSIIDLDLRTLKEEMLQAAVDDARGEWQKLYTFAYKPEGLLLFAICCPGVGGAATRALLETIRLHGGDAVAAPPGFTRPRPENAQDALFLDLFISEADDTVHFFRQWGFGKAGQHLEWVALSADLNEDPDAALSSTAWANQFPLIDATIFAVSAAQPTTDVIVELLFSQSKALKRPNMTDERHDMEMRAYTNLFYGLRQLRRNQQTARLVNKGRPINSGSASSHSTKAEVILACEQLLDVSKRYAPALMVTAPSAESFRTSSSVGLQALHLKTGREAAERQLAWANGAGRSERTAESKAEVIKSIVVPADVDFRVRQERLAFEATPEGLLQGAILRVLDITFWASCKAEDLERDVRALMPQFYETKCVVSAAEMEADEEEGAAGAADDAFAKSDEVEVLSEGEWWDAKIGAVHRTKPTTYYVLYRDGDGKFGFSPSEKETKVAATRIRIPEAASSEAPSSEAASGSASATKSPSASPARKRRCGGRGRRGEEAASRQEMPAAEDEEMPAAVHPYVLHWSDSRRFSARLSSKGGKRLLKGKTVESIRHYVKGMSSLFTSLSEYLGPPSRATYERWEALPSAHPADGGSWWSEDARPTNYEACVQRSKEAVFSIRVLFGLGGCFVRPAFTKDGVRHVLLGAKKEREGSATAALMAKLASHSAPVSTEIVLQRGTVGSVYTATVREASANARWVELNLCDREFNSSISSLGLLYKRSAPVLTQLLKAGDVIQVLARSTSKDGVTVGVPSSLQFVPSANLVSARKLLVLEVEGVLGAFDERTGKFEPRAHALEFLLHLARSFHLATWTRKEGTTLACGLFRALELVACWGPSECIVSDSGATAKPLSALLAAFPAFESSCVLILDTDRTIFRGNARWSGLVVPGPPAGRGADATLAVSGELSMHLLAIQAKANPRAYIRTESRKGGSKQKLFPPSYDA